MAAPRRKRGKAVELPENASLDPRQQKEFEDKVQEIKNKFVPETPTAGVVYLGHIPHGFFEPQMMSFFSQFGTVNRLRLARSRKTGRSKYYAYIEFEYEEVAKIVAETMNNYLMFQKLLKCQFIPLSEVHPNTFVGAGKKIVVSKPYLKQIKKFNKKRSDERLERNAKKFLKSHEKRTAKLKALGLEYSIKSVDDLVESASKKVQKAEEERSKKRNKNDDLMESTSSLMTKDKSKSKKSDKNISEIHDSGEKEILKTPVTKKKTKIKAKSEPPKPTKSVLKTKQLKSLSKTVTKSSPAVKKAIQSKDAVSQKGKKTRNKRKSV